MESIYFISLIIIVVLNLFFFFTGICLNLVVIISFWRSVQLRKKLCYFMILVLSCCDLLTVLTNNPLTAIIVILWLIGKLDVNAEWAHNSIRLTNIFLAFSLFALLVMSLDRYLATSYPIFHRTTVTKGKLLFFFAILIIFEVTLASMTVNDSVISYKVKLIIIIIFLVPPISFFNFKLFLVVRKSQKDNKILHGKKKEYSTSKQNSSCLLVVACFIVTSIPAFVYVVLDSGKTAFSLDNANLASIWAETIALTNCTFNSLIFYWKNKTLRSEGLKVVKSMKIWNREGRVQP